MPSRKIPPSHRSLTGLIASQKNPGLSLVPSPIGDTTLPKARLRPPTRMKGFESSLERDFLILLDFDLNVDRYEEQPVRIDYRDGNGRARTYTPDVLVYYRYDMTPAKWMKPLLCEVKYRADLFTDWPTIKPKIRAGRAYAREHGWRFQIVTEREVRTPYLDNAKFLRPYRRIESPWGDKKLVLNALRELREADPETLLLAVHEDPLGRAQLLPALWHLLATGMIDADLTLPLNMRTRIWVTA